ncbi:MAG: DUF4359 domain-containing protein [Cyanobium sp.]
MKPVSQWLALAVMGSGLAAGLVSTNPGPAAFADFAGNQLTTLLTKELCDQDAVSGLLGGLFIRHCPQLVRSQQPLLGKLVQANTRRNNLGLFSVYRTELDLAALLPGLRQVPNLRLPRYEATTLAGAGQFLLLQAHEPRDSREGR